VTQAILPPFRDEEAEVLDLITAYFAGLNIEIWADTETPDGDKIQHRLPFVRVGRVGGAPDTRWDDRPVVDIDVLARTRGEAKQISGQILQLLVSTPHPIDFCNVLMAPQKVEWQEGSPIRRMYASYHLSMRR
jgi:hypothetical protein